MSQLQLIEHEAPAVVAKEHVLEINNLSVGLDVGSEDSSDRLLLKDVTLSLAHGEILGIGGSGGSGKSLLCRSLVNWLPSGVGVKGGKVIFRGRNLLAKASGGGTSFQGMNIGYVGGDATSALDPTIPVGDQIVEKLRANKQELTRQQAAEKVLELFREVRLPSPEMRMNEYPGQYSGGMMQRAMIVDALITQPDIVVADDITQPLDVTVAVQIVALLKRLSMKYGTAVVFASSSLPLLFKTADRIAVLREGEVVEIGDALEVMARPRHEHTRWLMEVIPRVWQGNNSVRGIEKHKGPVLKLENVHRTYRVRERGSFNRYNSVKALRGVTLDVWEGENFGIIGESGCGKSTLTRLLTALERPDSGVIELNGRDLATLDPLEIRTIRKDLQLVLQDPFNALPPRRTVGKIIEEPLRIHRLGDRKGRRQQVLAVMQEVGLDTNWFDKLPAAMSAGERQRVNVARALVLEPSLLILDETLTALDVVEQKKLLELFTRLQAKRSLTYVFISHDLAMIRNTCNRVAVMYLGEVVEVGENQRLFSAPMHPYTKALLSAVPTIEPSPFKPEEYLLEGEPPSPIDLPTGCSFRSRCPAALTQCAEKVPPRYQHSRGEHATCFLCTDQ